MQVPVNMSRIVSVTRAIDQVSVGNPDIADILVLQSKQVYVLGKSVGTTNVVLWDENGRRIRSFDVEVTLDLEPLKAKLYQLLPDEPIEVRSAEDTIILSGEVSSAPKMDAALRIARTFVPEQEGQAGPGAEGGDGGVLNLMQVGGAQQVMLAVQVAEIARQFTRSLDIQFNAWGPGGNWQIGAVNGGATFPIVEPVGQNAGDFIPLFTESNPIGPPMTVFAPDELFIEDKGLFLSYLGTGFAMSLAINAAKNEGLAKILAEPTLTALSGQEANFLAGGEFPIPVPQGNFGGTTVEFKEFGVGLRFVPVVLDSGLISLTVNVSVSEVSGLEALVLGVQDTRTQFFVPSLRKRSAVSTIELSSGQTMGIAGLIDDSLREQVNRFPGLGELPVLGPFFRSQQYRKDQTELVILVTPYLAQPSVREAYRLPTDSFVEPDDIEFYLMGRLQGARRAPVSGGTEGQFGHEL
jgi:pilus assembly protein CpaC